MMATGVPLPIAARSIDLLVHFFLSGLHWLLAGLSELPLEQCIFLLLAGEPFSSLF